MDRSCLGNWDGALYLIKYLLLEQNLTPGCSDQILVLVWERLL